MLGLNNNIDITDTSGTLNVTGNTNLTAFGNVTQDPVTPIALETANLTVSSGSAITLNDTANVITGTIELSNPNITGQASALVNNTATTLGKTSIFGGLTITTTGGGLTLADTAATPSVTVSGGDFTHLRPAAPSPNPSRSTPPS